MIGFLLSFLVRLGVIPGFLIPILPIIIQNAPIFEKAISGVLAAIAVIVKSDPSVIHNIIVSLESKTKTNTKTIKVITTISGYNSNGEVVQIPNPD